MFKYHENLFALTTPLPIAIRHTLLRDQPFWKKMIQEDREELCQYIGMIDTKPLQIVLNASLAAAELCIVFNGLPEVVREYKHSLSLNDYVIVYHCYV